MKLVDLLLGAWEWILISYLYYLQLNRLYRMRIKNKKILRWSSIRVIRKQDSYIILIYNI